MNTLSFDVLACSNQNFSKHQLLSRRRFFQGQGVAAVVK